MKQRLIKPTRRLFVAGAGASLICAPSIVRAQLSMIGVGGGFGPAGGGAPTVTWDPAACNAGILLSLSNLKATDNSGAGAISVRATHSISTSKKYYFEFVANTIVVSATTRIGVSNASFALSGSLAGSLDAAATGDQDTIWLRNFANIGSSAGVWLAGAVVGVAVDGVNKTIWDTLNGTTWNAGGSASPAGNVGGADISGVTFPVFPTFATATFNNAVTARFDPASFTLATLGSGPLVGFTQWGS
jgi:hypothetical protein